MAIIKKDGNFMGLPMNIARGNPIPLDTTEIWYSLSELETYAKSGATAYVGQIVQLVDETANTATAYIIANAAGDLVEVGSSTAGDGKSIELTEDGILRLVGAGSAQKGAQLVMGDNGVISWVVPSTETVDGLNTAVTLLGGRVDAVEETVEEHGDKITALENKFTSMGGVFNFAGSKTQDEFANVKVEDYDAGDVILVDGVKEYVCVEYTENGTAKKRWEVLGDPSGVVEVSGRVDALETWKSTASTTLSTVSTGLETAKSDIENLETKASTLETNLGTKASKSDLDAAKADIQTNITDINGIKDSISTINTTLTNKADKTALEASANELRTAINKKADQETVNNIINTYATDEELTQGLSQKVDKTTYNNKMAELEAADSTNFTAIANVKTTADQAALDIEALEGVVAGKASAQSVTDLTTRVGVNETNIGKNTAALNSLSGTVTGLSTNKADKSTVEELSTSVANNTKAISDHAKEYETLKGRVDGHDTSIGKAQEDATKGINDAAAASTAAATAQAKGEEALAKAEAVLGKSEDTADKDTVFGAKAAAAAAQAKADAAQNEVDALEETVADLSDEYKAADTALGARIDAIDEVIGGVQGAMHFVGVSITDPKAGPVVINGKPDYAPANGDVVIYKDDDNNTIEYIYSDGSWVELGDVSAESKRIGVLEGEMDVVQTAVAKIPGIEEDVDALEAAKASLEARIKVNEDNITAHGTAITGLTTRIGDAEKNITDTAAAIRNELAAKAAAIEKSISDEAALRSTADAELQRQINVINGQLTWTKLTSV